MVKPVRDISALPFTTCPLCKSKDLAIVKGERKLFGKHPDHITCPECTTAFRIDGKGNLYFTKVPSPYVFFEERFAGWVDVKQISVLAECIRTDDSEAINYLSGARKYIWRLKLLLSAEIATDGVSLEMSVGWNEPSSIKEANQQLTEIRQLQREIRQLKRELNLDMKQIRAQYGRKKDVQRAKSAALFPYEQLDLQMKNLLTQLDRIKLIEIQGWIDEQKAAS
jgi:hypothetical protein